MKMHFVKFSATVLALVFFSTFLLKAQSDNQPKGLEESQKAYLIEYLNAFDSFINNPDKYWDNKNNIQKYFEQPQYKRVFNFLSAKLPQKGYITPDSMVKHIYTYYPDGLGIGFSADSLKLVGEKKNLFSKTYVFKTHIEYSGIRNDKYLQNYNGNQYFYLKSKSRKNNTPIKVSRITDKKFYQTRFKKMIYRVGFIVEPHISFMGFSDSESKFNEWGETHGPELWDFWDEYNINFENETKSPEVGKNYGIDLIYMFTPSFGIGTGLSSYSQSNYWFVQMQNYWYYNYKNIHSNVFGFIPDIQTNDFDQAVTISSPTNIPVFLRLQHGWGTVSLSIDLGVSTVFKPTYSNYIDGQIIYRGVSIVDGRPDFNTSAAFGFGTFNFKDELVHQHKSDKNITYAFSRFNFNVNLSKNFYFRVSSLFHRIDEIDYKESWNMFDMYALRLKGADMSREWMNYSMEFGIGFNVTQMIFRSRYNEK
jgi:hypothetical protein